MDSNLPGEGGVSAPVHLFSSVSSFLSDFGVESGAGGGQSVMSDPRPRDSKDGVSPANTFEHRLGGRNIAGTTANPDSDPVGYE